MVVVVILDGPRFREARPPPWLHGIIIIILRRLGLRGRADAIGIGAVELGGVGELGVAAGELLDQGPELGGAGLDPHGVGDVDDLDGFALGLGSLGGFPLPHAAEQIVHGGVEFCCGLDAK